MELSYVQSVEWNLGQGKVTELILSVPDAGRHWVSTTHDAHPDDRVYFTTGGGLVTVDVDWDAEGWWRVFTSADPRTFLVGYTFLGEEEATPSPVPIPAAGLLMVGGLGVLGALRARRLRGKR